MAGEKLGKAYEAFLFNAASSAKRSTRPISWNPPLPDLMVQPDLVVGDLADPEAIVLITRSAARRGWDKKFWRNVGEIVDIRSVFPRARIVSIALGTEVKNDLADALEVLVDENVFPSRETREAVEQWLVNISSSTKGDRDEVAAQIAHALVLAPRSVQRFSKQVGALITTQSGGPSKQWASASKWLTARSIVHSSAQKWEKPAAFRRGLSKLLVSGDPSTVLGGIDSRFSADREVGKVLSEFGWATKSITGWRVTDPEICGVLAAYPREVIAHVLHECASDELRAMCADLASVDWLRQVQEFLRRSTSSLSDAAWVSERIADCRRDSSLGGTLKNPPAALCGSWLFRALVALVKVAAKKKQGFGYEQLVGDVRSLENADRDMIIAAGATSKALKAAGTTDSLRRKLVDWVSGLADCELSAWQVLLVSVVVVRRLDGFSEKGLNEAIEDLPAFLRRSTYEDRVAPYRYFEPLPALLRLFLSRAGLAYEVFDRHRTLISESSESDRAPGTTPVIKVGSTLIHWKSAHDSHTSDKTKELCGRGFTLRHRVTKSGAVELDPSVSQLALVLDGDFDEDDVRHLRRSGWDTVVSSQHIPVLVQTLSAAPTQGGRRGHR